MVTTLEQLYALTIPAIQDVFLEVMQNVVDRAMLDEMVKAIEANDADALFQATGFTPAVLGPILDRIEEAYQRAAEMTVDGWPNRIVTPTGPILFTFNMRSPIVEEELKNFSSMYITRITEEVRQNVRETLERGMIRGDNPRKVALDIVGRLNPVNKKREGGVVGLSQNQTKAADRIRTALEQLDSKYFTYELRDKRFDKYVQKHLDDERPLSKEDVTRLVSSYKQKALKYRGEMIARTESIQAINRGENSSYIQAIEEGILNRNQIKKEWDDVGDRRTRTTHGILGSKYGKGNGITFEEPFLSPSGARLLYPGDQSLGAPAEEVIHCRCKLRYRVDWAYNDRNRNAD